MVSLSFYISGGTLFFLIWVLPIPVFVERGINYFELWWCYLEAVDCFRVEPGNLISPTLISSSKSEFSAAPTSPSDLSPPGLRVEYRAPPYLLLCLGPPVTVLKRSLPEYWLLSKLKKSEEEALLKLNWSKSFSKGCLIPESIKPPGPANY